MLIKFPLKKFMSQKNFFPWK